MTLQKYFYLIIHVQLNDFKVIKHIKNYEEEISQIRQECYIPVILNRIRKQLLFSDTAY
jgi:hypothetical protein